MQQFLVLFREPDGRKDTHTPEEIAQHRKRWNSWSEQMNKEDRIAGGMPLTLTGKILRETHDSDQAQSSSPSVGEGPHKAGEEIVGGYLLINAHSLDEAATLMQSCPIFEFGGYAEIREGMTMPASPSTSGAGPTASGAEPSSTAARLKTSGAEPSTAPSLREQNKAIVRRFNTAYIQEGDIAAFHEIIDPSIINHTAPAGFSKGADGIRDVIELFRKALAGLEVKILRQVAEDDIVVTHKTFHATHTGALMGIPPSGKPIVITIIDIVRLHNGKYIEHWGIRDLSGLRAL
ncbi:MAG TPA: ester cyclase [Puia sp.]|nr:ester cyclase [Puia sp.]